MVVVAVVSLRFYLSISKQVEVTCIWKKARLQYRYTTFHVMSFQVNESWLATCFRVLPILVFLVIWLGGTIFTSTPAYSFVRTK